MSTKGPEKADFAGCMQNRELSWLKFNERVLQESDFASNPPLERLKFIAIFSSNLDEFFMVRVGSLTDYMLFAPEYRDNKTGMTASKQLDAIFAQTAPLCALKDKLFDAVTEELGRFGVQHLAMRDLDKDAHKSAEEHFVREVMPLLSPQIIDSRHPFPHIDNKRLHIAVTLEHKSKRLFGLIATPTSVDRLFFLEDGCRYVLLEDMILHFAHFAFSPYAVRDRTILSVTRNADINTEEDSATDESIDYRQFMRKLIKMRRRLAPVRLELHRAASEDFKAFFCEKLHLKEKQVFLSAAPQDLSYCFKLEEKIEEKLGADRCKRLTRAPHIPYNVYPQEKKANPLKQVQKKDLLFSYPFESIAPFLEMIRSAAEDAAVLSIMITLYRIDAQSKLAESLIRAAENGKEVVVLMELRARFDEANNIEWSQRLDEAGCRVIYGPSGYKVHSKICLITRREFGGLQRVTQIGTGNYNEKTVRQYTDLSLVTTNREISRDAAAFFNKLLLGNIDEDCARLWAAPHGFKKNILRRIEQEQRKAENGETGRIIIKCNSLTDKEVITKMIEASQSGVKISLIVRGACCLLPRIPGFTENITVISIVGRFLEHSRIFCFGAGADTELYISSADLMTRNTERRIEIACPVLDADLKQRICEMLETMLADNTKAWELFSNGRYVLRRSTKDLAVDSQEMFAEQARVLAARVAAESEQTAKNARFPSSGSRAEKGLRRFFAKFR